MASSYDPRLQLEKLVEKQMKSVLHAKFLEDCLSDKVVPKGLELKLKVRVRNDPEDLELQTSVDKLLEKTSLHVLNIVKEGHMRKVKNLGNSIEEVRGKLKKNMSNKQMFDMDSAVFRKNIMAEKHKKKLTYLKQRRAGEKSTEGNKKEQRKIGETVSTVHISSDSTPNLPSNSEKTKPKKANKRRKKKSKSKSNKQTGNTPNCPKTGPVTDDDDVIIVGESTKQTKHQPSKN